MMNKKSMFVFMFAFIFVFMFSGLVSSATQIASIQSITITEDGGTETRSMNDFFTGYDSINIAYNDDVLGQTISYSIDRGSNDFQESVGQIRTYLSGSPATNNVYVGFSHEGYAFDKDVTITAIDNDGADVSASVPVLAEDPNQAPSVVNSPSPSSVNLGEDGSVTYAMNDIFENYNEITASWEDNTLSQSVSISSTLGGSEISQSGDFNLTIVPTSNNVYIDIFANGNEFDGPVTFTASNDVGSVSQDISLTTSLENPPEQITNFATISMERNQTITRDMTNFFTGYDTITLGFDDEFSQQTIQLSDGQSHLLDDSGVNFLNVSLDGDVVTIESFDEGYTKTIDVFASNSGGTTSDSMFVEVSDQFDAPPTQIANILGISLGENNSKQRDANNFFNDFSDTFVGFQDEFAQQSVLIENGDSYTISDNGTDILKLELTNDELNATSFSQDYSIVVTFGVSNSKGTASDDLSINIDAGDNQFTEGPRQIASIPAVDLGFSDGETINVFDYFTNIDLADVTQINLQFHDQFGGQSVILPAGDSYTIENNGEEILSINVDQTGIIGFNSFNTELSQKEFVLSLDNGLENERTSIFVSVQDDSLKDIDESPDEDEFSGSNSFFVDLTNRFINLFPDSEDLNTNQKMIITGVIFLVLIVTFFLLIGTGTIFPKMALFLVSIKGFLLLSFLIYIGYVPTFFIVSLVILALIIIGIRVFGGGS